MKIIVCWIGLIENSTAQWSGTKDERE